MRSRLEFMPSNRGKIVGPTSSTVFFSPYIKSCVHPVVAIAIVADG